MSNGRRFCVGRLSIGQPASPGKILRKTSVIATMVLVTSEPSYRPASVPQQDKQTLGIPAAGPQGYRNFAMLLSSVL